MQQSLLRDRESDYEWEQNGEPIHEVIEGAAHIPSEAVSDALEVLGERHYELESVVVGRRVLR